MIPIGYKGVFQTIADGDGLVGIKENHVKLVVMSLPEGNGFLFSHNAERGGETVRQGSVLADDGDRGKVILDRVTGRGIDDMRIPFAVLVDKVAFIAA